MVSFRWNLTVLAVLALVTIATVFNYQLHVAWSSSARAAVVTDYRDAATPSLTVAGRDGVASAAASGISGANVASTAADGASASTPSCPFAAEAVSFVTTVPKFSSLFNKSAELVYSHVRANPTPTDPELCVTFLSCRRYDLLARAMGSIVKHLESYYGRNLTYEIAHFDNYQHANCSDYVRREFVDKFHVNKHGSSFENHGFSFGINTLVFGFCRAPFVLNLEEDWEYDFWTGRKEREPPLIRHAIEVLKHDNTTIGVYLSSTSPMAQTDKDTFGRTASQIPYRRYAGPNPAFVYGSSGGVYNRAQLQRVGFFEEHANFGDGEAQYKERVRAAGLTMAWLTDNTNPSTKEAFYCLEHRGGGRQVNKTIGRPREAES